MKISSGKVKIESGKLHLTNHALGLTLRLEIKQILDSSLSQGGDFRYMVGPSSSTDWSNKFFGVTSAVSGHGETDVVLQGFVPNAIPSDNVIDCWFYWEETSPVDAFANINPFEDEIEDGTPGTTNGRLPIKMAQSPQSTISIELEWEAE